jgi:hypothetical protein
MYQQWNNQPPPPPSSNASSYYGRPSYQHGQPTNVRDMGSPEQQQYANYNRRNENPDLLDRGETHQKKHNTGATIGGRLLGCALTGKLTGAAGGAVLGNLVSKHRHRR